MGAGTMRRGGGRRDRGRRSQPMSEINVTPFVDVMLVLLIIFMVAAPLLTVGVPLQLPRTAAEAITSEPEEPLTISVPPSGPLVLMTTEVPAGETVIGIPARPPHEHRILTGQPVGRAADLLDQAGIEGHGVSWSRRCRKVLEGAISCRCRRRP